MASQHRSARVLIILLLAWCSASMLTGCISLQGQFQTAIETGDVDMVRKILDHGKDPNYKVTAYDFWNTMLGGGGLFQSHYPITVAAYWEQPEVVIVLLEYGADPNAGIEGGHTALYYLAGRIHGSEDAIEALLHAGADVRGCEECTWKAIDNCVQYGSVRSALLLLNHGAWQQNEAEEAAESLRYAGDGRFGSLKSYVIARWYLDQQQGIDVWSGHWQPTDPHAVVNDTDYSLTPLAFAASRFGNIDDVKRLLADGADPNEHSRCEWTALWSAVESENVEVVRLLLDAGADPNVSLGCRDWPETLLMTAVRYFNYDLVSTLIDGGADCNAVVANENLDYFAGWNRTPDAERIRALVREKMGMVEKD